MLKTKEKGFTLVELVITIAIVIILSVISVPIYRGYVDKAKLSEGYALLGTLLSAQKSYYSEYGNFYRPGISTAYSSVLGVDARGNKYFSCFSLCQNAEAYSGFFRNVVHKPNELITTVNGHIMTVLRLDYDITNGSTFYDYWAV